MSREAIEQLVDRWMNEPRFRDELLADPEEAVSRSGLQLNPDEWATLRNVVVNLSDEALQARISKGWSN
jgi:hypothetical protein